MKPLIAADDLAARCKEILEWGDTGMLAGGEGGSLRALAERLMPTVGERYALSIAEDQTKKEAMQYVVNDAQQVKP